MGRVLIRGARQLVTLSGPAGPRRGSAMRDVHVIADGAVLLRDGIIEQAGSSRRVERLGSARNAQVIDVTGRVVIPGFVDAFTRLLCGPPRDGTDDSGELVNSSRRALRTYTPQRMELEARKRLRQFLRNGTTSTAGACGYGLDEQTEIRAMRVMDRLQQGPVAVFAQFFGAGACPAELNDRPGIFLERLATEVLPFLSQKRLAKSVVVSEAMPESLLAGYMACARKLGFRLVVDSAGRFVPFALDQAADVLAGIEDLNGDHLLAIAASDVLPVLLPGRVFQRGRGYYPRVRALIDAGGAVALGTGFDNLTSPTMSMPMIMALACTQMGMTPAEALTASTLNAACALGADAHAGSLEPGKRADIVVIDCGDYREIPLYFGVNLVETVIRNGKVVYSRAQEQFEAEAVA